MKPEIVRTQSFVDDAVALILNAANEAIEQRGHFRISLSGGNTPRPVYQDLGLRDCQWSKWIVTFGDERCVPPEDKQSNYRMASEAFLLQTNPGEVYRLHGELEPDEAAILYEQTISSLAARFGEKRYSSDVTLLGLGDDGHTSSLFPGTAALTENARNVVSNFVPKFNSHRLTSTYPLINASRCIVFLINDSKKEAIINQVLEGGHGYPAEKVKSIAGETLWLIGMEGAKSQKSGARNRSSYS
jgi:6-phosphogluconolactonase